MEKKIIGELQEKSLHSFLKYYYEVDEAFHEIKVGSFYADIKKGDKITEIQTRSLDKLRGKLDYYLDKYKVCVIYPIAKTKTIKIIDGDITKTRKSPKTGLVYDSIKELYKIKKYLNNPNLEIKLVFLDVLEERIKTNRSRKGFFKVESFPIEVKGEIILKTSKDYLIFVSEMGEEFTSSDLSKQKKINKNLASLTLTILKFLGVIKVVRKEGKAFVYVRN